MENKEKLKQYCFVIKELTGREIKRKYTRSYLGILWSVLSPLLSMAVMSLIFSTMFQKNIKNFPLYYLTGSIIWNMFTQATDSAMTALVDNRLMLIKVKLPMSIFPFSRCCTALVNFGYSLIAYVVMLAIFHIAPNIYMLLLLLYATGAFFFSLGIGYLLSVLYTQFGDIKHLYSILLMLWMYMSAIFYPVESTSPEIYEVILHNPVYNYISASRKCVLYAELPNTAEWLRMIGWSVGMYLIGRLVFCKMQNKVMQKL